MGVGSIKGLCSVYLERRGIKATIIDSDRDSSTSDVSNASSHLASRENDYDSFMYEQIRLFATIPIHSRKSRDSDYSDNRDDCDNYNHSSSDYSGSSSDDYSSSDSSTSGHD